MLFQRITAIAIKIICHITFINFFHLGGMLIDSFHPFYNLLTSLQHPRFSDYSLAVHSEYLQKQRVMKIYNFHYPTYLADT